MAEHPVRRKLRIGVLPWVVSGRRLRRQWLLRLHSWYGFSTDAIVALSSIGLASPWFSLLSSGGASEGEEGAPAAQVNDLVAALPKSVYYPAVLLIVTWILIRVRFEHEGGSKRAILAKSCARSLGRVETQLYRVLDKADPMPDLNRLLDEELFPAIDRCKQEDAYPFDGIAPGTEKEIEEALDHFCSRFEEGWAPAPGPLERAAPTSEIDEPKDGPRQEKAPQDGGSN